MIPFTKQHSAYAWVVTCILFLINLTFHNLPLHSSYKIHQPITDYFLRLPYSELLEKRLFRSPANRRLVLSLSLSLYLSPSSSPLPVPKQTPRTKITSCRIIVHPSPNPSISFVSIIFLSVPLTSKRSSSPPRNHGPGGINTPTSPIYLLAHPPPKTCRTSRNKARRKIVYPFVRRPDGGTTQVMKQDGMKQDGR